MPYLEGQGHWRDCWISSIRARRFLASCANAWGVRFLSSARLDNFIFLTRNSLANIGSTTKPYSSGGNLPRRGLFPPVSFGRKNSAICEAALRRSAAFAAVSRAIASSRSVAWSAFAAITRPPLLRSGRALASALLPGPLGTTENVDRSRRNEERRFARYSHAYVRRQRLILP